jgi:biopolymer transport protein ExbD
MAELNAGDSGGGKKGAKKVRSKKLNSKVDLTAMVDLAFLLITFFMLTTSLSKPQSMDLGLPDKKSEEVNDTKVDENRTMTILLGANNKIQHYMGFFEEGKPKTSSYGKSGIRAELLKQKAKAVQYSGDPKKGLIVIIKPSKKSTYKNLVDVLDEMAINKIDVYAIVDITPEEEKGIDGTTGTTPAPEAAVQ